jgi:hypothetical protein
MRALADDSNAEERKELLDALDAKRKLVDSLHKNDKAVVPIERVMAYHTRMTNLMPRPAAANAPPGGDSGDHGPAAGA